MAENQGFKAAFGQPYIYQEGSDGTSYAIGIDNSSSPINNFVIQGSTSSGAVPVGGNLSFTPSTGEININSGSLAIIPLAATPGAAQVDSFGIISTINNENAGYILTSNGTGTLPTFQAIGSSGDIIEYTSIVHMQSPYVALSTDYYISCDVTLGVISVLLPNAPLTGRVFIVKDQLGLCATSNITVTTVGGAVNIDGATSFVMNTAYQSIDVIFNGTSFEIF